MFAPVCPGLYCMLSPPTHPPSVPFFKDRPGSCTAISHSTPVASCKNLQSEKRKLRRKAHDYVSGKIKWSSIRLAEIKR